MSEPDELYTARDLFYVANFDACITEIRSLPRMKGKTEIEKQGLLYKCQIGLGKEDEVVKELQQKSSIGDEISKDASIQSILYLASFEMYLKQNATQKLEGVKEMIESKLLESEYNSCATFLFVAATIYSKLGLTKEALKLLGNIDSPSFEHMGLSASMYLSINRLDQAKQIADVMIERDEDNTLSQLVNSWVSIQTNNENLAKEAAYVYQDMIMKFGATTLLLNGAACAYLVQGNYEDALDSINQALEIAKETNPAIDSDTLINAIMCFIHLGKPQEEIMEYLALLTKNYPNHPYVSKIKGIEEAFAEEQQTNPGY